MNIHRQWVEMHVALVMLHKCQYVALLSVQIDVGDTQGPGCLSLSTSDDNLRRADALVR